MSRHLSLRHDLLDNQLVDCERVPIGRVVDLDLELGAAAGGAPPPIPSILTGSEALGRRLGGRLGHWIERLSARLRPLSSPPGPTRIPVSAIGEIGLELVLRHRLDDLQELAPLEHWLRRNFIGRIPGATRDAGD